MAAKKKAAEAVPEMKNPKVQVYQDRKSEWRWRLIAKNGRILADSGEGYNSKTVAKNRASLVWTTLEVVLGSDKIEVLPPKVKRAKKVPARKAKA